MLANEKRSHAGPLTPDTPRDELPALADAIGSGLSSGHRLSEGLHVVLK